MKKSSIVSMILSATILVYYVMILLSSSSELARNLVLSVTKVLPGAVGLVALALVLFTLPLATKSVAIQFFRPVLPKWLIMIVSIVAIVAIAFFSISTVSLSVGTSTQPKVVSIGQPALITIGIVVFLLTIAAIVTVSIGGNAMGFIDDIKSFPLMSPVFCFGAPAMWDKQLESFGIQVELKAVLNLISFGSGVLFLVGIVAFFVVKNLRKTKSDAAPPAVHQPDGALLKGFDSLGAILLSLIMTALGFLLFVIAVIMVSVIVGAKLPNI